MCADSNTAGSQPDDWTRKAMKGLPASLGALWTRRTDEGWRYGIQLDESHCNSQGVIHGGVLMTFMDHALSLLVWEAAGRVPCSTAQLDSHFLNAVRPPAFVELDAEIIKKGKSLIFARGVLRLGDKPVMKASGVWSVLSER